MQLSWDGVQTLAEHLPVDSNSEGTARLLLVDDDPVNLRVLRGYLDNPRFELVEASDGELAIDAIDNQGPFDLVLLDVMMPKVSGYEVCKHIRGQFSLDELPVLLLTAKNQLQDLIAGFAAGANDHLTKPVSGQELLCRVDTQLKVVAAKRALAEKHQKLVDTQQQLVQSEKMASLGVLTAGVAHEINNPNNFVFNGYEQLKDELQQLEAFIVELAGDDADSEMLEMLRQKFRPSDDYLSLIKEGSDRIGGIIEDLKVFSQVDTGERQAVKIADCLQATVNLVKSQRGKDLTFTLQLQDNPLVECLADQINQVLMHVLNNACDAVAIRQRETDDMLTPKITVGCRLRDNQVEITVADNGCGMSDEVRKRMFEPFFTTKPIGQGTGLGLSISFGIVKQHDGSLEAESEMGRGTKVRLTLPL